MKRLGTFAGTEGKEEHMVGIELTAKEVAILNKLAGSESQLISRSWRGANRSGYLRYSIDGKAISGPDCESLRRKKLLIHDGKSGGFRNFSSWILTDLGRAEIKGKVSD